MTGDSLFPTGTVDGVAPPDRCSFRSSSNRIGLPMPKLTVDKFLDLVTKSKLVDHDRWSLFAADLKHNAHSDEEPLAEDDACRNRRSLGGPEVADPLAGRQTA